MKSNVFKIVLAIVASLVAVAAVAVALATGTSDGTVASEQKISDTAGSFGGDLDMLDNFGASVASIGDLDGDGVTDLAVGAVGDDDSGGARGAVWILFMNNDGTVASEQKISETAGNFGGDLDDIDNFGASVASIGDLDGDGVPDLAVGALRDDDGGFRRGAVWILFMNNDGTVASEQKISASTGDFGGALVSADFFGRSVASIGDLDGDGVPDLAVGADGDDDGGSIRGAVWILFMNSDGTVASEQKISDTQGNFGGALDNGDQFGRSVASIGDLDGDSVPDLAVGADFDDDGGSARGAVWILFMNNDGTVASEQKISDTAGNFGGDLDDGDQFGTSVASIGDLDGDGVPDLAVGALRDDDGGFRRGAVWILFMNNDGTVASHQKISASTGDFTGALNDGDLFGTSVASIGDLNGDGVTDLAVGTAADDGGPITGAVWILFMDEFRLAEHDDNLTARADATSDGTVESEQKISDTAGNFGGALVNGDRFGGSVASIGDLDGDGVPDLAVGAQFDDDGGSIRGAVWILFMNSDGTVASEQKISDTQGNFGGALDNGDQFGRSVAGIGDLDGDGVPDLAVGALGDDDGGSFRGAVWILFMNNDGTVDSEQKISDTQGNFNGTLDNSDLFGRSVAGIGDLDGDGVPDLAVGAQGDDDGGGARGAVWILFMSSDGTVASEQKISDTQGNFNGTLDNSDQFGRSVASIGDLDDDDVTDLAVGADRDGDGGGARGAVWILFMNNDGTVASEQKISDTDGNFGGALDDNDFFGASVAGIGDLDGDGVPDLVVGANGDDDGGFRRGAVWILFMDEFLLADHDDNLTARTDDIDAAIAAIEGKLDDATTGLGAIVGDISALDADLVLVDAKLDNNLTGLSAIVGFIGDLDAAVSLRATQISVDALAATADAINAGIGILEGKLDDGNTGLSAIVGFIGDLDAAVSLRATQTSVDALAATADAINAGIGILEGKLDDGNTGLSAIVGFIGDLDAAVSLRATQTSVDALAATADAINAGIGILEGKLDDGNTGLGAIVGLIGALSFPDASNLDAAVSSRASSGDVAAIEAKLDNNLTGLSAIVGFISDLDDDVVLVEAKLDNSLTGLGAIVAFIGDLDAAVSLRATQASVDDLRAQVDALKSSREELSLQVISIKDRQRFVLGTTISGLPVDVTLVSTIAAEIRGNKTAKAQAITATGDNVVPGIFDVEVELPKNLKGANVFQFTVEFTDIDGVTHSATIIVKPQGGDDDD